MEYEPNDDTALQIIRILTEKYDSIKAEEPDLIYQILFVTPEILTRIPQELESKKYSIHVYNNEATIEKRFSYDSEYISDEGIKELNIIQVDSCQNKEEYMEKIQIKLRMDELRNTENIYVFIKKEFENSKFTYLENIRNYTLDLTKSTKTAKFIIQDYGDKQLK